MRFKYVALITLFFIVTVQAENLAPTHAAPTNTVLSNAALPIDLIELLGEFDDVDTTTLNIALSEAERHRNTQKSTEELTIKPIGNPPAGGEKQ